MVKTNEQLEGQLDIFDWLGAITGDQAEPLVIDKPIRLIELFSGIGSQSMALRDIGADYEMWRTCEWEVNAIASYKQIFCKNDHYDYSEDLMKTEAFESLDAKEKYELLNDTLGIILRTLGISGDGKEPMSYKTIKRKSLAWKRYIYNNIISIRNMVDITKVKGGDLGITERHKYTYLLTYSFPCQ